MKRAIELPWVHHSDYCFSNVFMRSIEETRKREDKMASFCKRHVNDALTMMSDTTSATTFLQILNNCHSSAKFTIETESSGVHPFLVM